MIAKKAGVATKVR